MANSHKPRKHAASVHFDEDLWDRVTKLAARERRPISQLLRNLVADAVDGRCGRCNPRGNACAASIARLSHYFGEALGNRQA
jgi:hypothetical protein